MRPYFRPFPGLTLVTLVFLVILISLGTWQYHRLQWKTGLISEIDAAASAQPLTGLSALEAAAASDEPIDFRRINLQGRFVTDAQPFHVYKPDNQGVFWNRFVPFIGDGQTVFVNIGAIPDSEKDKTLDLPTGEQKLAGYVRVPRPQSRFASKSTPSENRWFGFNPMPETHNWADRVSGGANTDFYIDASDGQASASQLPIKRPDIRNNHLDYMLTWYSFAFIWLFIYVLLHYRRGRLGFR